MKTHQGSEPAGSLGTPMAPTRWKSRARAILRGRDMAEQDLRESGGAYTLD